MIHSDVEPISPPVYSSELAGGEQATRASGAGDGGDPSSAEGELVESPEVEVQQQAPIASPTLPSHSERMEHRITHLPYRSWCDECVEAFGRERSHRSTALDERVFPLVSVDYMFLSPKGLILKDEASRQWEDPPDDCIRVLAGICSSTKAVFAFAVPQKGADAEGYAAKNLVDNILWLGHARAGVRSDNEPAILKLVNTAVNVLKLNGMDVTVEGSAEYDPQSNGAAESAVRLVKGQVRALQVGLENDIKSHIPVGHPVITWLVRHAAMVRTMRVVGADGKTAWQRARGSTCKLKLVNFGEVTRYKCRSQENGIGQSGFDWGIGIWLGVDARTGQHILVRPNPERHPTCPDIDAHA